MLYRPTGDASRGWRTARQPPHNDRGPVKAYLDEFAEHAQADEVMPPRPRPPKSWLKSYDLLADVWHSAPVRGRGM
ncbi:hypothetical protein OPAG_04941 [Rhodococcus opacus PD630]|nr:hypothetical protein Pd630_LPD04375 [Rhodococcus opacus PD630]EHI44911.1 hypothetical protein OPAG_04941 [Rhodococcus opacus PD630]KXF53568.1 hypothetical protein AXA44_44170 [Rhodococcus sp. SC4]KXX59385.1 hypothetical protein AZG88_41650 [Rhodococcus sp. LB1]